MLQTLRERWMPTLFTAVIGLLLALGLLLPVLRALEMGGTGLAVMACVVTSIACAVAGLGGKFRWIGLGAGGGLLLLIMAITGTLQHMGGMAGAAMHLIRGNVDPLKVYGPEAALLAGILLSIATWAMARQGAGFYPALSMTMVVLLVIWFSAHRDAVALFAPALIALCAMFARSAGEETPVPRVLVASALAVILALLVSPVLQFRSPALEDLADRLRTYITDTMFFTDPRSVYSIQVDGYKPLETRLGGPVSLDDHPIMTVQTPTTVLLRGSIYNDYNGLNWSDTLATRRYLYTDVRNRAIRADALDEQRPSQALRSEQIFQLANIEITMQTDSASTLFVPQRTQELATPMALVPYFNMSTEVFITRNLQAGDTYSMQAPILNATDSRLEPILAQARLQNTESRDMTQYLRLPEAIAPDIYGMTADVTAGASTPFEQARAIQLFLQRSFRYTLIPEVPPGNQDFVSYFLLKGKEGYCTYFASAMAVMGRIAGLPTRYIEGYIAHPSGGTALVTSKSAHAWAEVYFDGFGWVAFDATPPEGQGAGRRMETADDQPQDPQQEPAEPTTESQETQEESQEEGEGTDPTTDTASEPPTSEEDSGETREDPTGDLSDEETTEETTEEQTQNDEPSAPSDPTQDDNSPFTAEGQRERRRTGNWWIWLLVAAAVALLIWRGITTRPDTLAAKQTDDSAKLLTWYRALLGLLTAGGMPLRPYETPMAYAERLELGIPQEAGLSALASAVTALGYGKEGAIGPEDVTAAAACYHKVARALPLKARAKWLLRRLLRGIGSVEQIP